MKSTAKVDVLLDGLTFPEGPRWRDGKLWFSDFYTNRVMTVDPKGRAETIVEVPQRPSGLGWTLAGDLQLGATCILGALLGLALKPDLMARRAAETA